MKILLGATLGGVRTAFWYEFVDGDAAEIQGGLGHLENPFGLVCADLSPKPAWDVFALVGGLVPGSRFSPDAVSVDPRLVTFGAAAAPLTLKAACAGGGAW